MKHSVLLLSLIFNMLYYARVGVVDNLNSKKVSKEKKETAFKRGRFENRLSHYLFHFEVLLK